MPNKERDLLSFKKIREIRHDINEAKKSVDVLLEKLNNFVGIPQISLRVKRIKAKLATPNSDSNAILHREEGIGSTLNIQKLKSSGKEVDGQSKNSVDGKSDNGLKDGDDQGVAEKLRKKTKKNERRQFMNKRFVGDSTILNITPTVSKTEPDLIR